MLVITHFRRFRIPNSTILVADSYYLTATGREALQDLEVLYLCSINPQWWQILVRRAHHLAHHAGETAALFNHEAHELFIFHWYEPPLGKKWVITNMFHIVAGNPPRTSFLAVTISSSCSTCVISSTGNSMTSLGHIVPSQQPNTNTISCSLSSS
eukprot:Phypoly_transcript_08845.p1 GENE.Phypoly_transcript_08845~~Phypoly_transcript_08845.p1  ORF type:complete len:155 (+),score=8.46 Phypoly_transcript_08845:24-488(+)